MNSLVYCENLLLFRISVTQGVICFVYCFCCNSSPEQCIIFLSGYILHYTTYVCGPSFYIIIGMYDVHMPSK